MRVPPPPLSVLIANESEAAETPQFNEWREKLGRNYQEVAAGLPDPRYEVADAKERTPEFKRWMRHVLYTEGQGSHFHDCLARQEADRATWNKYKNEINQLIRDDFAHDGRVAKNFEDHNCLYAPDYPSLYGEPDKDNNKHVRLQQLNDNQLRNVSIVLSSLDSPRAELICRVIDADPQAMQFWKKQLEGAEKDSCHCHQSPDSAITQACPDAPVGNWTESQKRQWVMDHSAVKDELIKEFGSIPQMLAMMAVFMAAMIGLAATGFGALAEAIAAVALVAGAAIAGKDIGTGISKLIDFFQATRCDRAKTIDDLETTVFASGVESRTRGRQLDSQLNSLNSRL